MSSAFASKTDRESRTYRLVLEYHGAGFEGWQAQSGPRSARTVQGVLAEAMTSVGCGDVRIRGAGRTDAGVHAAGQVASVQCRGGPGEGALKRALNARLPADLAIVGLDPVPADWDALREARGKHYRYQIWNRRERSPLHADRWYWVNERLDLGAMSAAAERLVGRHDFASFQAAGSSVKTTVRRLESIEVIGAAGSEIRIEVRGEGFLRHMVRNLAGTLVEVGRGRWDAQAVEAILAARDRSRAGPTAPAAGLILVAVRDSFSEGASVPSGSVDEGSPVG